MCFQHRLSIRLCWDKVLSSYHVLSEALNNAGLYM